MALVELDVAPAWMAATQITAGGVGRRIGACSTRRRWRCVVQFDLEYIVSPWLAVVTHADARLEARYVIIGHVVADDPAMFRLGRVGEVAGDRGRLHVHAGVMIDVVEVAPERAVLDATRDTEIGLGARRSNGNPAAAGDEAAR